MVVQPVRSLKGNVLAALRGERTAAVPYLGDGSFLLADWPGRKPPREGKDGWGVGWAPLPGDYVVGEGEPAESYPVDHPAAAPGDVPDLPLPDLPLFPKIKNEAVAVIGQHPAGPLDRFMSLLGPERAYLALGGDRAGSAKAMMHIAFHHVCVAHALLASGADAAFVADDYAGEGGPLLSPKAWEALVLPAVASILDVYRRAGVPVIFHTCGKADPFIGPLLDAGVTAFNLQTDLCDLPSLRRRFGRIAFYGGVPSGVMLHGTPDDVRAAVRWALDALGREGGLLLAPDQPLAYGAANRAAFAEEGAAQSVS